MRSLGIYLFLQLNAGHLFSSASAQTCSITEEKKDPLLKEMSFDLGYGTEYFEAFLEPDIETISNGKHDKIMKPNFEGHAVKFFNMSPDPVELYWLNTSQNNKPHSMGICKPFHSMGTASFVNHKFLFGPKDYEESNIVLKHFQIDAHGTQNLYYYDPLTVEGDKEMTEKNLATLTMSEYEKYSKMDRNRKFADEYLNFTGREYHALYPRDKPKHFMWPADHIGQVNNIVEM